MEGDNIGFYVMAAPALRGLSDEFHLTLGKDEARAALYRYGRRCGTSLMETLGIHCETNAEVLDNIPLLISESGLGYGKAGEGVKGLVVSLSESLEASSLEDSHVKGCFFTAGYLAGLVSGTSTRRFECIERKCITKGSNKCIFLLYPTDKGWEAYAPKKVREDIATALEGEIKEEEAGKADEKKAEPSPPKPKKDITPSPGPTPSEEEESISLECGSMYLLKEDRPEKSYDLFLECLGEGEKGLCITREFPKKVRAKHPMGGTKIIWLSTTDDKEALDPTKLSALFFETQVFLKENPYSTVLLSGMEFLVTHNSFLSVLKFIQLLSEQASIYDAIFLMPINPGAFDKKELINLEREMMAFPGQ
ncbi:MAG: DUF835 domain-containing protein [Thermoplasmata archaeon]|nr:DUF835 domain-containing protein [Thermoplasmata archaeon]